MGHQPIGLASPAAALREARHHVDTLDLAVESPEAIRFAEVDLVAISMPMHTAARLGIELAHRIRRSHPELPIACYGLYVTLIHDRLTHDGLADYIVGGEYEPALVALANQLGAPSAPTPADLIGLGPLPSFPRQHFPLPSREGLPPLSAYARLRIGDEERFTGYVEASRGCAHQCTHCPITPVYGGRLRLVQPEIVLADIDQLVEAGAEHITFGDPDFLNAVPHSLAIIQQMHARRPALTFDATIKVEHLLEHTELLPRLREHGALFITSAFESTNDAILHHLAKGHVRADLDRALAAAEDADLIVRPTWVAHTPWTTPDDFLDLLAFIENHGLVEHVQSVQYAIRLLLPPGSPLIATLETEGRLDRFDDEALTHIWRSSDPRLDALQIEIAKIVEAAACTSCDTEPAIETFRKVKAAAHRHLRADTDAIEVAQQPRRAVPGLTESWFC
jgi:radical SAM superfamily enzyme YgiQ (UPF0313 family)